MEQNDVLRIYQEAKHLTETLIDQLEQSWEYLRGAVKELTETVDDLPCRVERFHSSDQRFATVCDVLEKLEMQKRRLDERFSAYLGMDLLIADANMKLLGWEGEIALSMLPSNSVLEQICDLRALIQRDAASYADNRAWAEHFIRVVFPRFLEELYRLSDGEQGGRSFRMQSVAALCGGFCNGVKIP